MDLAFSGTMRDIDDFVYEDKIFPTLPLYEGNIAPTVFESVMKHYLAGYQTFVENGGLFNHNTYQMHQVSPFVPTICR